MNSKITGIFIFVFFLIFSGGLLVGYGTAIDDVPGAQSHGVSLFLIPFGGVLAVFGGRRLFRAFRELGKQSAATDPGVNR